MCRMPLPLIPRSRKHSHSWCDIERLQGCHWRPRGIWKVWKKTAGSNGCSWFSPLKLETVIWGRGLFQTHQHCYKPMPRDATFDLFGIQKCFGGTTRRITLDPELLWVASVFPKPLGIRRMPSIYLFKRGSDTNMLVLLILLIFIALQIGTLKVWGRKGGELKNLG